MEYLLSRGVIGAATSFEVRLLFFHRVPQGCLYYNLLIILFNMAGFLMNPAYFIPNKRQVSCIVALKIQGEYI
jgi:hypothetical protein